VGAITSTATAFRPAYLSTEIEERSLRVLELEDDEGSLARRIERSNEKSCA
jgi:hypothetical protein